MIKGDNIYLRYMKPSDVLDLNRWENSKENETYSEVIERPTISQILKFINSIQDIYIAKKLRYMICPSFVQEALGAIDLFSFDKEKGSAGISILIAEEKNRNKGHGGEALDLLIKHCEKDIGIKRLFCNIHKDNEVSLKLFKSKGFGKPKKDAWHDNADEMDDKEIIFLTRQ